MEDKILSELIELAMECHIKWKELDSIGVNFDFLGHQNDKLEELIMDLVNIPKDTTVELEFDDPNIFCRDYFSDWFNQYYDNEITKEKLIFNLKNWKSL